MGGLECNKKMLILTILSLDLLGVILYDPLVL